MTKGDCCSVTQTPVVDLPLPGRESESALRGGKPKNRGDECADCAQAFHGRQAIHSKLSFRISVRPMGLKRIISTASDVM
jgi:hypothetical protein